jgi:hypothetical protein
MISGKYKGSIESDELYFRQKTKSNDDIDDDNDLVSILAVCTLAYKKRRR